MIDFVHEMFDLALNNGHTLLKKLEFDRAIKWTITIVTRDIWSEWGTRLEGSC